MSNIDYLLILVIQENVFKNVIQNGMNQLYIMDNYNQIVQINKHVMQNPIMLEQLMKHMIMSNIDYLLILVIQENVFKNVIQNGMNQLYIMDNYNQIVQINKHVMQNPIMLEQLMKHMLQININVVDIVEKEKRNI